MAVLFNFIIGFLAAFVGMVPPGLLNMSAAKISMKEGRKAALLFSLGVSVTVIIQTFAALLFARYLDKHPEIVDVLKKVGLGIFICLTVYFFFIAKDSRREMPEDFKKSKRTSFFSGMLLGVLNLLPIPYWIYVSITFARFGMFDFSQLAIFSAVIASGLGTLAMLTLYIQFFKRKDNEKKPKVNMNYVIGTVTALISIITFLKILKEI